MRFFRRGERASTLDLLVVGLGNPGREYEQTRHNVGWWLLDHLADVWRLDGWRRDGETMTVGGTVAGHPVRLVKPLTYMNLSGQVLRPYLRRPAWSAASDLMVVVDEVAKGVTDGARLEKARRELVQERLEGVVVVPVDENDVCVGLLQAQRGAQPAEPSAEDDDAWEIGTIGHERAAAT